MELTPSTAKTVRRIYRASTKALQKHLGNQFLLARFFREMLRQLGEPAMRQWIAQNVPEIPWSDVELILNAAVGNPPNSETLNDILRDQRN